jgi:lipoprotein-anchoring transpeptidase ErfK/SrfK
MRTPATLATLLLATGLLLAAPAVAAASILITIDKSTQRMTVVVDGVQRYAWPVSTGRNGYATPSGAFKTFRMEEEHYSKEFDDAPMPHSIFFTREGHAIHGTLDARHLGSAASHGCVRLSTANAARLYALVERMGWAPPGW